ncbi:MAG: hypothetical protein BGO24_06815 [Sphingomonas sp. 67-36]|nr:MAG: hypothetical protein BGO24_06815 [Sphingomonas sp. 67-36]
MQARTFIVIDFAAAQNMINSRAKPVRRRIASFPDSDILIKQSGKGAIVFNQMALRARPYLDHGGRWILHAAGKLRHRAPVWRSFGNSSLSLE